MGVPLRVLLVEDRDEDAELVLRTLRRAGFEPTWMRVDTVASYLDSLGSDAALDAILCDFNLPGFNALWALEATRERGLDVPFIVITGSLSDEAAVECLRRGAADYLLKDRLGRLGPAVRRALEERAARAEHARARERFRTLIENVSEVVAVSDGEGRISYVSPSAARVLGYAPDGLVGRSLFALAHPDDAPEPQAAVRAAVAEPGVARLSQFRAGHRDGSWRHVEMVSRAVPRDAATYDVISTLRDVTERQQLEEQLRQSQKLEAIGQLAGGVAHDFNNLLTVIMSSAELLSLELDPSDHRLADLDEISAAARRAASLTRQLLAFSRREVVSPQVLDVNEVVDGMGKMLRRLIGEHIELRMNLWPDLWPVKMDRGQLEQVILNLAVNARDAMPQGGTLTVETAAVEARLVPRKRAVAPDARAHVLLSVRDTGTGMDLATQRRVFEPFFTTKGSGKGTGLGLSTVHGIVGQANGCIELESALGQGTVFRIYLPRTEELTESAGLDAVAARMSGRERVLVVEDEETVRAVVRRALASDGYRVIEAQGAQDAVAIASREREPIDLLLTDVVMPEMNGPQLAQRLSASHPGIKVLYMSGYLDDAVRGPGGLGAGVALIGKPFTTAELAQAVRRALDNGGAG